MVPLSSACFSTFHSTLLTLSLTSFSLYPKAFFCRLAASLFAGSSGVERGMDFLLPKLFIRPFILSLSFLKCFDCLFCTTGRIGLLVFLSIEAVISRNDCQ